MTDYYLYMEADMVYSGEPGCVWTHSVCNNWNTFCCSTDYCELELGDRLTWGFCLPRF